MLGGASAAAATVAAAGAARARPPALSDAARAAPLSTHAVTSYNVLSDALCTPEHFAHSAPADCDADARFARVLARLDAEMAAGAIVCLQEVSRAWGARLVPEFERRGYAYAAALSGGEFGGYMGQCVAWPRARYAVEEVRTPRLTDAVPGWTPPLTCRRHSFP